MSDTNRTPLSDRVKAAIGDSDPMLIREIQMTERIAMSGVAHVAANGKFPHWPIQQWILVIGFTSTILTFVFVTGVRWNNVERDVEAVKVQLTSTTQDISKLATTMKSIDDAGVKRDNKIDEVSEQVDALVLDRFGGRVRARPSFPRSEQFAPASSERNQ